MNIYIVDHGCIDRNKRDLHVDHGCSDDSDGSEGNVSHASDMTMGTEFMTESHALGRMLESSVMAQQVAEVESLANISKSVELISQINDRRNEKRFKKIFKHRFYDCLF